jgi:predicted component of type VI protein secretion system
VTTGHSRLDLMSNELELKNGGIKPLTKCRNSGVSCFLTTKSRKKGNSI